MTPTELKWPLKSAYRQAIINGNMTLYDPMLRQGKLKRDKFGPINYGGAGLYVCIYRIDDWLLRCFCSNPPNEPPPDIRRRYQEIERFCREHANDVPALIPITYEEEGIAIGNTAWPIVKMPFLNGTKTLGSFIEAHHGNSPLMGQLADAWLRLIAMMEAVAMAHGDLDTTNVLVEYDGRGVRLRLIDYDNMFIPALAGHDQYEEGHEHFQHPAFMHPNKRPYDSMMDRFAALSIYISLRAIAAHPALYAFYEPHRLILCQDDYRDPDRADGQLVKLSKISGLAPLTDELRAALRERRIPQSLTALVEKMPVPLVVAPQAPAYQIPAQHGGPKPAMPVKKPGIMIPRAGEQNPRAITLTHPLPQSAADISAPATRTPVAPLARPAKRAPLAIIITLAVFGILTLIVLYIIFFSNSRMSRTLSVPAAYHTGYRDSAMQDMKYSASSWLRPMLALESDTKVTLFSERRAPVTGAGATSAEGGQLVLLPPVGAIPEASAPVLTINGSCSTTFTSQCTFAPQMQLTITGTAWPHVKEATIKIVPAQQDCAAATDQTVNVAIQQNQTFTTTLVAPAQAGTFLVCMIGRSQADITVTIEIRAPAGNAPAVLSLGDVASLAALVLALASLGVYGLAKMRRDPIGAPPV